MTRWGGVGAPEKARTGAVVGLGIVDSVMWRVVARRERKAKGERRQATGGGGAGSELVRVATGENDESLA
jgi:hypothetical protein